MMFLQIAPTKHICPSHQGQFWNTPKFHNVVRPSLAPLGTSESSVPLGTVCAAQTFAWTPRPPWRSVQPHLLFGHFGAIRHLLKTSWLYNPGPAVKRPQLLLANSAYQFEAVVNTPLSRICSWGGDSCHHPVTRAWSVSHTGSWGSLGFLWCWLCSSLSLSCPDLVFSLQVCWIFPTDGTVTYFKFLF